MFEHTKLMREEALRARQRAEKREREERARVRDEEARFYHQSAKHRPRQDPHHQLNQQNQFVQESRHSSNSESTHSYVRTRPLPPASKPQNSNQTGPQPRRQAPDPHTKYKPSPPRQPPTRPSSLHHIPNLPYRGPPNNNRYFPSSPSDEDDYRTTYSTTQRPLRAGYRHVHFSDEKDERDKSLPVVENARGEGIDDRNAVREGKTPLPRQAPEPDTRESYNWEPRVSPPDVPDQLRRPAFMRDPYPPS